MVARPRSSSRLSCGERLLLRCDGNAGNSFPTTQGNDPSTREEARESRPHPEEPRFRLLVREEGSFPCVVVKEFPTFPSHLKRRHSKQERREELQHRATIPRVPRMSQSIPGKPVFPALPRLSSRGSTHTTVARGTSLWESLVGKPPRKATDSWIHAKGSMTLLLQLWRKMHVHASTRDED